MQDSLIDGDDGSGIAIDVGDSPSTVLASTLLGTTDAAVSKPATACSTRRSPLPGARRLCALQLFAVRLENATPSSLPARPGDDRPERHRSRPGSHARDACLHQHPLCCTPAYGQLTRGTAPEIRTGADNGAEMGVWNLLQQPQREANLLLALDEYLRYGLEAAPIFVN